MTDNVMSEVDEDLRILDYKKHLTRPLICDGDGPINKWRDYANELFAAA